MRNLLLAWLLVGLPSLALAQELKLYGDTVVRFASPEEGRQALSRRDDFTRSLSRFDLQCRLDSDREVTVDDLLKHVTAQVIDWTPADHERLGAVIANVSEKLRPLKLSLPPVVWLVKTTGKDESNAAYCRGPAIVLPKGPAENPNGLEKLFVHELFHVLSSSNRPLQKTMYGLIGFQPCPDIELPPSLRDRKLTNPDAPLVNYYLKLQIDGAPVFATPLLFASAERYDPQRPGNLFRFLTFRLVVLRPEGERFVVVENEQGPVMHEPTRKHNGETIRLASFFEQVGDNTGYIIHPEEILADNFVHLVVGTKDLKTPRVVNDLRRVLSEQPSE